MPYSGKRGENGEMRPTTLKDARILGLLPSVTTILQVVAKPGLVQWQIEQAILAVVTAPDVAGESIEDKITRVLPDADQERDAAASLGTRIHEAIASTLSGSAMRIDADIEPHVGAAINAVRNLCRENGWKIAGVEEQIIGEGYAGTLDLFLDGTTKAIVDFKTTKTEPGKKVAGYVEQRMQLGAYAKPKDIGSDGKIINVYISTTEPGRVDIVQHEDWESGYAAFMSAFSLWKFLKGYHPTIHIE